MTHDGGSPPGGPSPLDAVRGRYARPSLQRWMNLAFTVVWLALGVGQALRDRWPYGLVVGLLWGPAAAAVWLIPAARIGDKGIRLGRMPLIAWSQVSDVAIPVDNGWKLPRAQLVLVDGRREALPMLSRTQAMRLREHVAQE